MYCTFFGFRRNPFSLIAQANCDYLPTNHQLISNQLVKSLDKATGITCLLGPVGVGKSTLVRKMIVDYKNQSGGLIFKELDVNNLSVTDVLSNESQQRLKTIYLLDHADSLSDDLLEKLLTTIAKHNVTKNPVLLILIGSSLLESQLKSTRFESYQSLLNNSFILERLDHRAVNDYILHRLQLAEYTGETLFDDSAIQAITKLSKGIPRVINTLCGNSLFQASLYQQHGITEETVNSAAEFCILEKDAPEVEASAETPATTSNNPLADKVLELPDEIITQSLKQVAQMLAESGQIQNRTDPSQDTPIESDLEQQSDVKSPHSITKPIESVITNRQDSSNMDAQEVKQEAYSPILPIKASNDAVISSETTETKPVLTPHHSPDVIPEIPNHSNTDNKHIGFGYKKVSIAAAVLLSLTAIIWTVGQQPTKQSNFDAANTDKKIQFEAPGELKTIRDPEESIEVANIAPLDTTENPLNSAEIEVAQIVDNDVSTKHIEHPEQVTIPAITENKIIIETKTDTPHGQAIEHPDKDIIRTKTAALIAKGRLQEDSGWLTQPEGDNAVETFRDVLKIEPDNIDATQGIQRIKKTFIQRAESLKNQGQWQKAEISIAKALQLDPENSTLENLLADIRQHIASLNKTTSYSIAQTTESPSSSNLADHQEQATKQRASARYQLTQRGITFNFENFIAAAESGDNTLLQLFLDANMPINVQDDLTQNTVLIAAAKQGHLETINMILTKNPDLNWQDINGQTALITAAANGHHRIINHLLLHGAKLHIRDNLGRDALMLAVEKNQVATVKILLARGASQHTKDITGQNALSIAKNKDYNEIASLLQPVH